MKARQGITMLAGCLLATAAMCASHDSDFARHAASAGLTEITLGKLAMSNGESADVKHFGQRMVQDHPQANDQLMTIATREALTIPTQPLAQDQAVIDRLSKLHGSAFDLAYSDAMLKDHRHAVALFGQEARDGSDSQLKAFAASTLPTLKEHMQMAQHLSGEASTPASSGP